MIAQVANLCMMLQLYCLNNLKGKITDSSLSFTTTDLQEDALAKIIVLEEFKLWMLFEILVILSTVGTTIVFLFQRTFFREAVSLEMDDEAPVDKN